MLDGTITVTGGGGDITMTSTSIQAGVTVDATSLVFTEDNVQWPDMFLAHLTLLR